MNGVQIPGHVAVRNGPDLAGDGALLDLLGQQRHDVPVGLGVAHRRHRAGEDVAEAVKALGAQVPCLVVAGGRQHIVGPLGGRIHAYVDVNEKLAGLFQVGCPVGGGHFVAPEGVVGHRDHSLDLAVIRHPAFVDGLLDHGFHLVEVEAHPFFQLGIVKVLARPWHHVAAQELAQAAGFVAGTLLAAKVGQFRPAGVVPDDPGGVQPAGLAAVAGQGHGQSVRPAGVDAVGIAGNDVAQHDDGLAGLGHAACLAAHHVGVEVGKRLGFFRRKLGRFFLDVFKDGGDGNALNLKPAFKGRVYLAQLQGFGR